MRNITGFFVAVVALVLLAGVWILSQHGGLVALNEVVKQDWTDLDAQLRRRDGLIPDLLSAVKRYAPEEEGVFTSIADASGKLAVAASPEAKAETDAELTGGLRHLLVVAGSHPELTADESFFRLRKELADVERSIDDARRNYNEHVELYNMCIGQFPGSFFAGRIGLLPRGKFEPPSAVPAEEPGTAVTPAR